SYALLEVSEYWIVDNRGLGGVDYIGTPKQPAVTVCHLDGNRYSRQQYWIDQTIQSTIFPDLQITLHDLIEAIVDT
ncbi:MAG: Uma2 family endonuclease, partial [Leptolyngbya sp. SIO1D8]|nr:Uma2 family endonuclease [Leptolyngbya sp. SIO1D8]